MYSQNCEVELHQILLQAKTLHQLRADRVRPKGASVWVTLLSYWELHGNNQEEGTKGVFDYKVQSRFRCEFLILALVHYDIYLKLNSQRNKWVLWIASTPTINKRAWSSQHLHVWDLDCTPAFHVINLCFSILTSQNHHIWSKSDHVIHQRKTNKSQKPEVAVIVLLSELELQYGRNKKTISAIYINDGTPLLWPLWISYERNPLLFRGKRRCPQTFYAPTSMGTWSKFPEKRPETADRQETAYQRLRQQVSSLIETMEVVAIDLSILYGEECTANERF